MKRLTFTFKHYLALIALIISPALIAQNYYEVSFNFGDDEWGRNQALLIYDVSEPDPDAEPDEDAEEDDGLVVEMTTDAQGMATGIQLPDGNYSFLLENGYIKGTFDIDGADYHFVLEKYTVDFCLGNIVNDYLVTIYRNDSLAMYENIKIVGGKLEQEIVIPDGRYHYQMDYPDLSKQVVNNIPFTVAGENKVVGNCDGMNGPYYVPYSVYYDLAQQPEIQYMASGVDYEYLSYISWTNERPAQYQWTSDNTGSNMYILGDYLIIYMTEPGDEVTITSPVINPGTYNVYVTQRYNGSATRPAIDSVYHNGRNVTMNDGLERTFADWASDLSTKNFGVGSNIMGLHLAEIEVEDKGRQEITMKCMEGASTPMWIDLIIFIPKGIDPIDPENPRYSTQVRPLMSPCGEPVFEGDGYCGSIGANAANRPEFVYQAPDSSIYRSPDLSINYLYDVTVKGGSRAASSEDHTLRLHVISKLDNWTRVAETEFDEDGNATVTIPPGDYIWHLVDEGNLKGPFEIEDMDIEIEIPSDIATTLQGSQYAFTPFSWDPDFGIFSAFVKVGPLEPDRYSGEFEGYEVVMYVHGMQNGESILLDMDGLATKANFGSVYAVENLHVVGDDKLVQFEFLGGGRFAPSSYNPPSTDISVVENGIFSLYPNPVKDALYIHLKDVSVTAECTVYSLVGKRVAYKVVQGEDAINLSGLPAGIYMVQLKAGGEVITAKIIKE